MHRIFIEFIRLKSPERLKFLADGYLKDEQRKNFEVKTSGS